MLRFCLVSALVVLPMLASSTVLPIEHPIIGTWRFGRSCPETYEFKVDGTGNSTSAEETLQSRFEISAQPSTKGFYAFTDVVVKTNGKPDCYGEPTPVGDVAKLYIRFSGSSKFLLCVVESTNTCVGPFERIPAHAP